jgi:hypothetical protein
MEAWEFVRRARESAIPGIVDTGVVESARLRLRECEWLFGVVWVEGL